jgi:RHS repeat-associated protein
MRALALVALSLLAGAAHAQSEIILDNGSPQFAATGTWPTSNSVAGYIGTNYQSHEANGAPPGAIMVDNTSPGFSTTGTWPASTSVAGYVGTNYQVHASNGAPPTAIVADNSSGSAVGTWPTSTSTSGYYGTNYQTHAAGTGTESFAWTLEVATAGTYEVYARWTAQPNRASNARYTVTHSGGEDTVVVNQQTGSASWQLLGTYSFDAGAATVSLSDEANGYVVADAVMLAPPGAAPNTATWSLAVPAAGTWNVYARWTQHPNRATNAKYTVNHSGGSSVVTVNQMAGGGTWSLLGAFALEAGTTTVSVTDQADGYVIADAVMIAPPGAAPNTATWTPNVAQGGQYEVYARWTASTNRASNATYTVTHASGQTSVPVNQQANGGAWNLLGTFTLNPGTAHIIALTDQANGYVIADAIRLVPVAVQAQQKLYFIEVDHLDTPRLVANATGTTVWRWDQQEPFGNNVPDENPSGLGVFDLPLRLPGQYFDKETNLHYNLSRDYDPGLGIYKQSDPIGLTGGANTYVYVLQHPLGMTDPTGLITAAGAYWHYCFGGGKPLTISYGEAGVSGVTPTSFASVAGVTGMPCVNAVIPIADSKPYTTTGEIFAVLGDVTVKLNGLLYTSCDCSWNFDGMLTVADDYYNFNPSTHRSRGAEAATTLGRWGGKVCGAQPYTIKISGGQHVNEGGKINGKPTCCGVP